LKASTSGTVDMSVLSVPFSKDQVSVLPIFVPVYARIERRLGHHRVNSAYNLGIT
jgi:hypothetical protein